MQITKEWLAFLREQFPIGNRIRLREMKDPYHPAAPGTLGTLQAIDDVGTFHCRWDNGRTLGLVIEEDSFTVLPPKPTQLKLYMPMTADPYEQNQWRYWENYPTELDASEAVKYADSILAAIQRERRPEEAERGMMRYYDGDDGVNRKVQSYTFTAKVRERKLWGAECEVLGTLEPGELEKELRVAEGLTLEQLADAVGISKSALASYENEESKKEISHESLFKLAKHYKVSMDYLFDLTQNKNHPNTELSELHLSDDMVDLLKSRRINNRLLCEIATHEDFIHLMTDAEIYIEGIAAMRIRDFMIPSRKQGLPSWNSTSQNRWTKSCVLWKQGR